MIVHRVAVVGLSAVVAVWWPGTTVASEIGALEIVASKGIFSDIGSVHAYGIKRIVQLGIDAGCGEGRFCSDDPISRTEMAVWLHRAAAHINDTHTPPPRADKGGTGVSEDDATVSRAEAAVMFTAAFVHLAATERIQDVFADTSDTPEATVMAIEGIHAAGLTKGCAAGPLQYCPHRPITRGQAATMLARAIQRAEPTVGLIVNKPQAAQGYTLINTQYSDLVYLIDHLGRKVHTWKPEGLESKISMAKLLENGNLMIRFKPLGQPYYTLAEIDQTGNIVWAYYDDNVHHDFLKLPNGNVLLLSNRKMNTQEVIAAGFDPVNFHSGLVWLYDYIIEVKPTGPDGGEVVWKWSTLDHLVQGFETGMPNNGPIVERFGRINIDYLLPHSPLYDITHLNSIDYNPVLGQIMLSSRNYSELLIINYNTTTTEAAGPKGDLLYRWGNPQVYDAGDYQDQQLFWQHDIHWIPQGLPGAGNVLIFNNGDGYDGLARNYSTIDEIALPDPVDGVYPRDPDGHGFAPAQLQWSYTAPNPADFYSPRNSGVQRLPNGNTQICDGYSGTIFQVTPDGTIVWKYINPQELRHPPTYQGDHVKNITYRAPWYPPDYPGLKNLGLIPQGPIEQYR